MRPADRSRPPLTEAQSQLAEANIRLAFRAALAWIQRFRPRSGPETVADAQQVACVALCHAAAAFDPSRGKFSTFVYRCVFHLLNRWIELESRAERLQGVTLTDAPEVVCGRHERTAERLEWVRSRCNEEQLALLDGYLAQGCTLRGLGRKEGLSTEAVRLRFLKLRRQLTKREVPGG